MNIFNWISIPVIDLDRALRFYSSILNTTLQKTVEEGVEFGYLPYTPGSISGCLSAMSNRKPSQDGPLIYLNVEGRLSDAVASVTQYGGKVITPIEAIGEYGYCAMIIDTEGNGIALHARTYV